MANGRSFAMAAPVPLRSDLPAGALREIIFVVTHKWYRLSHQCVVVKIFSTLIRRRISRMSNSSGLVVFSLTM